jgi:hypothetical protein
VWTRGAGRAGDVEHTALPAWYEHARVSGTGVVLSEPIGQTGLSTKIRLVFQDWWSEPSPPPETLRLGAPDDGPQHDEVARAIEAWMHGAHDAPLSVTWTAAPPPYALLALVLVPLAVVAGMLWRARLRVVVEGEQVRVESRGAFSTRASTFGRAEVRSVVVDARPFGPITLARPLVLTTHDRRIPLGALALRLPEAAVLAGRIRELLD